MGFLENYNQNHQHPTNRLLHSFGIPLIVISLFVAFWSLKIGLGLFVFGWILQFIGHIFEKKPPSFFSNPAYLITGVIWWFKKVFGLNKVDIKTKE